MNDLKEFRLSLHRQPEVSQREYKTAQKIAVELEQLNPTRLLTNLGGHGVAAVFASGKSGPQVLVRCELDGLPISDSEKVEIRSEISGVGHKCGHDGHMTILIGLARKISQSKLLQGSVILLFQPAEETGEGAQQVLNDPKLNELKPDYVIALHNLPGFPIGQVILKKGVFASTSCGMEIVLKGKTSHAAEPEAGISPALAVAQLIQQLSAIPQFHTSLHQAAQVTVVHAQVGKRAFGTSPGDGSVAVTVRAYQDEVMKLIKKQIESCARSVADMFGLEIMINLIEPFPATVNDDEVVDVIEKSAHDLNMLTDVVKFPFAWSEDFGHFTAKYKGAMFGFGSGVNHPALHHPDYDFPDQLIEPGIALFEKIIEKLMK